MLLAEETYCLRSCRRRGRHNLNMPISPDIRVQFGDSGHDGNVDGRSGVGRGTIQIITLPGPQPDLVAGDDLNGPFVAV